MRIQEDFSEFPDVWKQCDGVSDLMGGFEATCEIEESARNYTTSFGNTLHDVVWLETL